MRQRMRTNFHISMRWTYILITSALLWICSIGRCYGDTEFTIKQLTTIDGLSNNTVRHIMQDSHGNYWFATSNGLSLYRNDQFTNFYPDRKRQLAGLPDQRIRFMVEDNHEHLWTNTVGGWSCYDLQSEAFLDYKKKGWTEPNVEHHNVKVIHSQDGRTFRITDNDGLYIINKVGEEEHYTTSSKSNPLPTNALKCIFQDKDGVIWIGTDNLGITRLTLLQSDGADFLLEGEHLRMLMPLGCDSIAIANKQGDVWVYDAGLHRQLSHSSYPNNTYSVACSPEDSTKLWRGTKGGGLFWGEDSIEGMPHNEIYALHFQSDTTLWIGTFGEGLLRYNPTEYRITAHLLNDSYGSKRIRKILEAQDHSLWVATSDGVFILKHEKDTSQNKYSIEHLNVANGQLLSDEIRTIFQDSKGRMFIAEAGVGFAVWEKGGMTHYARQDSLVNDMVQCFAEDREGFIWIATELGISRFNPATRKLKTFFFSKNMLNNVYSENCATTLPDGRIAFGSNNGIVIIDPSFYNAGETTHIDMEDMTINGQSSRHNIVYIITHWWKSPWFIVLVVVLILFGVWGCLYARRREKILNTKNEKLTEQKDILTEQKELLKEQKDQLSREIHLRREKDMDAHDKEFVERMEEIADRNLANPDFSADDFASEMGLGRTVFFKRMKQTTGYSPKEYIKQKRIHQVSYLLSTTSLTVTEIADQVGINDSLYLSRIFKAEYKYTPTEWRNKTLGDEKD